MPWKLIGEPKKMNRQELKNHNKKSKVLKEREQNLRDRGNVTINIDKLYVNDSQGFINHKRLKEDIERR